MTDDCSAPFHGFLVNRITRSGSVVSGVPACAIAPNRNRQSLPTTRWSAAFRAEPTRSPRSLALRVCHVTLASLQRDSRCMAVGFRRRGALSMDDSRSRSLVPEDSGRRHIAPRDAELVPHRPEDLALSSLPSMPAVTPDERRRILTEEGFDADAVAEGLKQRDTNLYARWLPWVWLAVALGISIAVFPRNIFMPRPIDTGSTVPITASPKTAAAKEVAALMAAGKNDQALDRCREVIETINDDDLAGHAEAADVWHMYLGLLESRSGADELHDLELLKRVTVFAKAAPDDLYAVHYLALMQGRRSLLPMATVDREAYKQELLESVDMIANARLNIGASNNDVPLVAKDRWRREFMIDLAGLYERLWALEDYRFDSERREQAFAELRFAPTRSRRGVNLEIKLYRKAYDNWPRNLWILSKHWEKKTVNGVQCGYGDVQEKIKELDKELAQLPPDGAEKT